MIEVLERLEKILKLEEDKGFANTAVIGGLERFVAKLATDNEQLSKSGQTPNSFQTLSSTFSGYATLSQSERRDRVIFARNWLTTARSGQSHTDASKAKRVGLSEEKQKPEKPRTAVKPTAIKNRSPQDQKVRVQK